jgi:hypothetical protein
MNHVDWIFSPGVRGRMKQRPKPELVAQLRTLRKQLADERERRRRLEQKLKRLLLDESIIRMPKRRRAAAR